ncbi:hypothetical protein CBR_g32286 [Chara braunii]|uniref:Translation factor GUF1 homolog, mitochondrial n=1 Tax=Chara braunii TaxID=69332 RepID=A0A388JNB5_CHABU|nr:hypothetical protein CBR_g32286 [Chara braunii]|eukprot:GBG59271.1 hypothetical protein CBR_g32286 [Chara braunii]
MIRPPSLLVPGLCRCGTGIAAVRRHVSGLGHHLTWLLSAQRSGREGREEIISQALGSSTASSSSRLLSRPPWHRPRLRETATMDRMAASNSRSFAIAGRLGEPVPDSILVVPPFAAGIAQQHLSMRRRFSTSSAAACGAVEVPRGNESSSLAVGKEASVVIAGDTAAPVDAGRQEEDLQTSSSSAARSEGDGKGGGKKLLDLSQFPPSRVRNFSIIAHVDHGKSTLADRLLELTRTIRKDHGQPQYLDKLQVERERGITVKAQTATMFFDYPDVASAASPSFPNPSGQPGPTAEPTPKPALPLSRTVVNPPPPGFASLLATTTDSVPGPGPGLGPGPGPGPVSVPVAGRGHGLSKGAGVVGRYLLNLVDTPGHVDFSYEVSRSLSACQGVLLLVDACQGIQAQTVANFYLAFEAGLTIIPIVNKIDQPNADPERVILQLERTFDLPASEVLLTSAKTGQGLHALLPAVIERIPPPGGDPLQPLRMQVLDSFYDDYKGVICHVAVVDGSLKKADRVVSCSTGQSYEVLDVGIMHPELTPTDVLLTGQVGYVITGMRSTQEASVGDTFHHAKCPVEPLPGFKPAKHMVFAGVYPANGSEFEALESAVARLTCNDPSVSVSKETSGALGVGFRCGFLGLLHLDVFHQRLDQEYGAQVITTTPTVPYVFEYADGTRLDVQNPATVPARPTSRLVKAMEPVVTATIIAPAEYVGSLMTLCTERRGEQLEYSFIDSSRALLKYRLPLREVVTDFYNQLKGLTSGYASFDYEEAGYQEADLVKMDVLLNGQPVDALSSIVHRSKAQRAGRELVGRLKKVIDRQMFEVTIQAAIAGKPIASETLSAMRKNVLAKCYGGDVTRKRKLLEKQKEGKKRMKRIGSIDVPQEAFHQLLKT